MSYSGIQSRVLRVWAKNFSVLGLLGAENLVREAESQEMWREDTALPLPITICASAWEPAHF